MLKALIFGGSGQDGFFLSQLLREKNVHVISVSRSSGDFKGDIADYEFVAKIIRETSPDYLFSFAANSTVSHEALFENHSSISNGTINLLEAVRIFSPTTKVFLSGSALQFENRGIPICEDTPFQASSPYSLARIHSCYAARYFRTQFGLKIYFGFFFNHDSELRSARHVNRKIIQGAKQIKAGELATLTLGSLGVMKEFTHAMDIVEAVWIFVNQEREHELVIGSGEAHSIKEWVNLAFSKIQLSWEDFIDHDPSIHSTYSILVSNPRRLRMLNWEPKVSFEELFERMWATR